jgi:hypothetical protein
VPRCGEQRASGWCAGWSSGAPRRAPSATPLATRLTLPRAFVAERSLTLRLNSTRDGATLDTRLSLLRAPDARWFHLTSETPAVCAVVAVNAQGCDGCVGPRYGHQAARLLRDGVCTVRVEAPALDHGRGIRRRVSAEFYGVENFVGVFPTAE